MGVSIMISSGNEFGRFALILRLVIMNPSKSVITFFSLHAYLLCIALHASWGNFYDKYIWSFWERYRWLVCLQWVLRLTSCTDGDLTNAAILSMTKPTPTPLDIDIVDIDKIIVSILILSESHSGYANIVNHLANRVPICSLITIIEIFQKRRGWGGV